MNSPFKRCRIRSTGSSTGGNRNVGIGGYGWNGSFTSRTGYDRLGVRLGGQAARDGEGMGPGVETNVGVREQVVGFGGIGGGWIGLRRLRQDDRIRLGRGGRIVGGFGGRYSMTMTVGVEGVHSHLSSEYRRSSLSRKSCVIALRSSVKGFHIFLLPLLTIFYTRQILNSLLIEVITPHQRILPIMVAPLRRLPLHLPPLPLPPPLPPLPLHRSLTPHPSVTQDPAQNPP